MDGFHSRFRACRAEAGLTQQCTANEMGVAIGTVACLESGRRVPDVETLVRAADLFGQSLDWLLLGRGKKKSR